MNKHSQTEIYLTKTLAAYKTPEFRDNLKQEVKQLNYQQLPLQAGLSLSSYVSNEAVNCVYINTTETASQLIIKAGLFYSGIIAGCSCSDDPTPIDTQTEYCKVLFRIDKSSSQTHVELIKD